MHLYTYDLELFPNIFTAVVKNYHTADIYTFEWSSRRNQLRKFAEFINFLGHQGASMIGFNNVSFDYPIVHHIVENYSTLTLQQLFHKMMTILNAPRDQRFNHIIWDRDRYVRQIDLMTLNHFDNVARMTSLKILEFNMRSGNIIDLPFTPGVPVPPDGFDQLIKYNINDVTETENFYRKCLSSVKLRDDLRSTFGRDIINYNDTKIGKEFLKMELEKDDPGCCYHNVNGVRTPRQTPRDSIALGEILLPYIHFDHPEFQRIHQWFQNKVITETKGSIKDLSCTINGFQFDFGTGGIHGSIDSATVESNKSYTIIDIDVASFYPNLSIKNKLYPEHLSEKFCTIYEDIYNRRKNYAKGTPENKVFKLALNGSYGDSNNIYSPFYDPKFTMSITVNGQLSLCMLAEKLMNIPSLSMIQINTDGLTVQVHRDDAELVRLWCKDWEKLTKLQLEEAVYTRMFIRDVNNYIAEGEDGKLKRKGVYEYNLLWHQNQSALVVPKAAEAFLVRGEHPFDFLKEHEDIMDFMMRTKVPRNSRLMWGDQQIQNVSRYYISTDGKPLTKVMPPLAKKPGVERHIGIHVGWKVQECNNIVGVSNFNINYSWYLQEIEKLIAFGR